MYGHIASMVEAMKGATTKVTKILVGFMLTSMTFENQQYSKDKINSCDNLPISYIGL